MDNIAQVVKLLIHNMFFIGVDTWISAYPTCHKIIADIL